MNSSPALEIPEWMFDPGICSQVKQESEAHVSSVALLALKSLLSTGPYSVESMVFEAQHLSSSSGDADAFAVTLEDQSRRAVFSAYEAARTSTAPAIPGQAGDER